MDTPDDHTVVFHLRRPYYLFPELLCSPPFLMVSPEVLKHSDLDYVESHLISLKLFGHDDPCLDCMIERIESERDERVRRPLVGAAEEWYTRTPLGYSYLET